MTRMLSATSLALALAVATYGLAGAQGLNPGQPGSASDGVQAQAGQASRMNDEQIGAALRARGFSDIKGIERDGDTFKVSEAKHYGESVKDLRVDASTGQVRDEARLNEDQAKTLLRDRGYSDVSAVNRDDETIRAKAKQGDRAVNLRIDARSGMVTQQQASN